MAHVLHAIAGDCTWTMGRKRRRTEDAVEAGSGGDGTGAEVPERFADAKRKGEAVRKEKRARHTPAEEPRTWARTARATETHSKSGKFSKKEDQAILDAVQAYVTENSMGEEGIAVRSCAAPPRWPLIRWLGSDCVMPSTTNL